MEMKDYVQVVVNKFESHSFDDESQCRVSEKLDELKTVTGELVEICKRLDDIKRHIFYKKGEYSVNAPNTTPLTVKEFRVLHAAVGLATEGVEFLEGAVDGIIKGDLDVVHLIEENSDILWYQAVAADALGTSFEQIADANVSKLNIRYALKFSNDRALSRDLTAERAALEAATQKIECPVEQLATVLRQSPPPPPIRGNQSVFLLGPTETSYLTDNNVLIFPSPDELTWQEDSKIKYLRFATVLTLFGLGFLAALLGPLLLSTVF